MIFRAFKSQSGLVRKIPLCPVTRLEELRSQFLRLQILVNSDDFTLDQWQGNLRIRTLCIQILDLNGIDWRECSLNQIWQFCIKSGDNPSLLARYNFLDPSNLPIENPLSATKEATYSQQSAVSSQLPKFPIAGIGETIPKPHCPAIRQRQLEQTFEALVEAISSASEFLAFPSPESLLIYDEDVRALSFEMMRIVGIEPKICNVSHAAALAISHQENFGMIAQCTGLASESNGGAGGELTTHPEFYLMGQLLGAKVQPREAIALLERASYAEAKAYLSGFDSTIPEKLKKKGEKRFSEMTPAEKKEAFVRLRKMTERGFQVPIV
ncbi:MAG: hypothetical protein J7647_32195 [Cyanobacteria bacterium SBLK]|nr:hypothetical protein [Cyanobacteria bacterium SBLK]